FDQMQVPVDGLEPVTNIRVVRCPFRSEIFRLDDEGITLPPAAGRSPPLTDAAVRTTVQRNDSGVVDHFVENHHVIGVLYDLHVVVIRAGHHWRPCVETDETTFVDRKVLRASWRAPEDRRTVGAPL